METCSNCGAVARPGAKFCTTCGSRLTAPEAPAAAGGWQQPSPTASQVLETTPAATAVSASQHSGETETGTAASNAETGVATEPQGSTSSSWTWGSSTEEESDTREDSGSGVAASSGAGTPAETIAATNVTAAGDSAPAAWSWNAPAADVDDNTGPDASDAKTGKAGNGETGTMSDESTSESSYADEPSGSSRPWSWGASDSESADDAPVRDTESTVAREGGDVPSTPPATVNDEFSGATASESTRTDSEPQNVDVSSAFNDPNDSDETLSSWAARWNATETGSEESSAESTGESSTSSTADADIDFTQRSPLEGAPGGELPADDVTGTKTEPAIDYGIEGAPGGQVQVPETKDGDEAAAPAADDTTSDAGIEGAPGGYAQESDSHSDNHVEAETLTSDNAGTSPEPQEVEPTADGADEPSGSYGSQVTPGTDADLIDPLVGMEVTPVPATPPAAGDSSESMAFETSAATIPDAGKTTAVDARERAELLIDELRELLPSLAGSDSASAEPDSAGAGSLDLQPVIDELEAARPVAGQFDELRTALETARSNRRDVDTMLDLVGRVDDLITLLDSQDRLDSAVGQAIDQLQSEGDRSED